MGGTFFGFLAGMRCRALSAPWMLPLALAFAASCSSESKKETLLEYPEFELADPAGTCRMQAEKIVDCAFNFEIGTLMVGNTGGKVLRIVNTGSRAMHVTAISLVATGEDSGSDSPFSFRVTDPALQQALDAGEPLVVAPAGMGEDGPVELNVTVEFTKPDEGSGHTASLTFQTDAANAVGGKVKVLLSTLGGAPSMSVSPEAVRFDKVPLGSSEEQRLTVLNTGSQDLIVDAFQFKGSKAYTLIVAGKEYPLNALTEEGLEIPEPLVIGPQKTTDLTLRFAPPDADVALAKLILFSNDPKLTDGLEVPVIGNEKLSCLVVKPDNVQFGGTKIGTLATQEVIIEPCEGSTAPVTITGITLKVAEGLSDSFTIDYSELDHLPTEIEPLILPVGTTAKFAVNYFPEEVPPPNIDGEPASDEGIILIDNDSFEPVLEVPVKAFPVEQACPTAVIKVAEGDEVIPQTVLHLQGGQSFAPMGNVVTYAWQVEQPEGSASVLMPSAAYPDPEFEANVAGLYVFSLEVWDSGGTKSCVPGTYEVMVVPDQAIHVELLWHTPNDADETDMGLTAGADLDLHFAHPSAQLPDFDEDGVPDPWFHDVLDCYWFNSHPQWANTDPTIDDNPGLDRDDTDGAGPENLNLAIPENNLEYPVGVHYWDDNGFGVSNATIRVYIYGTMIKEIKDVPLQSYDFWYAAKVVWPSGAVVEVLRPNGTRNVTEVYPTPFYQ